MIRWSRQPPCPAEPLARKRFIAHFIPSPRQRSAVPWSCSLPCRPRPPLARLASRVVEFTNQGEVRRSGRERLRGNSVVWIQPERRDVVRIVNCERRSADRNGKSLGFLHKRTIRNEDDGIRRVGRLCSPEVASAVIPQPRKRHVIPAPKIPEVVRIKRIGPLRYEEQRCPLVACSDVIGSNVTDVLVWKLQPVRFPSLTLGSGCPEAQPRELFADNPQLVLRVGFVEPVDHPDQRADMLLGHLKELLRALGRHRTSSGRTATVGHGSALPTY